MKGIIEMTLVKSNLCPTCGGLLDIDLDKQMYFCPFCGVSFDYEYFREDNVKEVASKAIIRNEYGSAKDAYDFILAKDPHDFDALRGLFICKNKWQNMYAMKRDSEVHVSADEPTLQNALKNCLPEHRPYFEKVREALSELTHYRELTAEAEEISKKRSTEQTALNKLRDQLYHNSRQFKELCSEIWYMDVKTRKFVIFTTILLPIAAIIFVIWKQKWAILITILVIDAFVVGSYHLMKAITAKYLLASMVPYEKKIRELTEQHDAKKAEAVQSRNRYRTLVQEFMDMDPVSHRKDRESSDEKAPE